MKTVQMPKTESMTIVVAKPTQRLHWAPATQRFTNKKRKAELKKFRYQG
jgi:hypothetical protein